KQDRYMPEQRHNSVQFAHRMVAYLLLGLAVLHAADCTYHDRGRLGAIALACVLLLQATLGIVTLLWHVPILLALAHRLQPIDAQAQARSLLWHVPILLALAHQSVAIGALIVATVHAANLRSNKTSVGSARASYAIGIKRSRAVKEAA